MSIFDIFMLSGIVFAFVLFALVLAWGDHQTRRLPREQQQQQAQSGAQVVALKRSAGVDNIGREAGTAGRSDQATAPV
jgi:hypothetical protein